MGFEIFRRENWGLWEDRFPYFALKDIRNLDREKDRLLLEYMARFSSGRCRQIILKNLGLAESPAKPNTERERERERCKILRAGGRSREDLTPEKLDFISWSTSDQNT